MSDALIVKARLEQILESIDLVSEWSEHIKSSDDFLTSMHAVMTFNACVMRLQVIGEHVGRLLKLSPCPLDDYKTIPWLAIYDMRNIISHEYANIDETIVFSVIKEDLPVLRTVVEQLLARYR